MSDKELAIVALIISVLSPLLSFIAYKYSKNKDKREKLVKLRIASDRAVEVLSILKKMTIIDSDSMTKLNVSHDKETLTNFIENIRKYRNDLAEFPISIANVLFLIENSAENILHKDVESIDNDKYEYDVFLRDFDGLYFGADLIFGYISANIIPDHVNSSLKINQDYFARIHSNIKSTLTLRSEQRCESMKEDMRTALQAASELANRTV